jgi:hypothetical protein
MKKFVLIILMVALVYFGGVSSVFAESLGSGRAYSVEPDEGLGSGRAMSDVQPDESLVSGR